MNFFMRLFYFSLIALFGCKPKQNQADWVDPTKISQHNMVELITDLPPSKLDRAQKPRGKQGEPLLVPRGTKLLSRGVKVTSSDDHPIIGEIAMITDGNAEVPSGVGFNGVQLWAGLQWVQLDLGKSHALYAILVWHYYSPESEDYSFGWEYTWDWPRVYQDVVVQISNDPTFRDDVITVFNNDHDNSSGLGKGKDDIYIETSEGHWIDSKGVEGRYIRLYSNGYNRFYPDSNVDKSKQDIYDKRNQANRWTESEYMKKVYENTNNYIEVEVYGK
jgi:hypothetical protein